MNQRIAEFQEFKLGHRRLPEHLKPKKKEGSGRLFKNEFLEKLTHTPLWVPQAMYIIICGIMLFITVSKGVIFWTDVIWIVFAGSLTWSLAEYFVHRLAYHTEPESDRFYQFQFNAHGVNHHYPKDDSRLAMPPIPSLVLSSVFFGVFYLIMGKFAFAFWPGFIFGYLAYITLHYYQHVVKSPKYGPWKKLWRHHKAHHYSDPYSAFGVTTRLWDWVFGTMPDYTKK